MLTSIQMQDIKHCDFNFFPRAAICDLLLEYTVVRDKNYSCANGFSIDPSFNEPLSSRLFAIRENAPHARVPVRAVQSGCDVGIMILSP